MPDVTGKKLIEVFSHEDYDGHNQNITKSKPQIGFLAIEKSDLLSD